MDKSGNMPKKNFLSFQIDPAKFATASDAEKAQQVTQRQSVSYMRDAMRRLRANKLAMFCLCLLIFITLIAIIVPYVYPYNYTQQDVSAKHLMPFEYSRKEQARIDNGEFVFPHIMGTDNLGRDYCIRVIYGTRISLMVGFVAALIVVIIGIIYGSISGYFGGKVDAFIIRVTELFQTFPSLVLNMILAAMLGRSMFNLILIFICTGWMSTARLVRNEFMSLRNEVYVKASEAFGMSKARVMFTQILPNTRTPIIVSITASIPGYILSESSLSFLGLGVSDTTPTWGNIINSGTNLSSLMNFWWLWLIPGLLLTIFVLSVNYFGDGLRDLLDPKQA